MAVGDVLTILPSGLAGFVAPAAPPPPANSPTYLAVTHMCPATHGGAVVPVAFDFDFAGFPNAAIDIEAKILGATKGGTANVIGAIDAGALDAVETRNGVVQQMQPAAGGFVAIFQVAGTAAFKVFGNDASLVSGGGAPMSIAITYPGLGIVRFTCTNQNTGVNDIEITVRLECMIKAAP
jgi:hypothetical protein